MKPHRSHSNEAKSRIHARSSRGAGELEPRRDGKPRHAQAAPADGRAKRNMLHRMAGAVVALAVLGAAGAYGLRVLPAQRGDVSEVPRAAAADKRQAPLEVTDTPAPPRSGWVTDDDGVRRYYDPATHELYSGWLEDGDDTLYIDGETGQPHVGWLELDGKRYWLDDGQLAQEGALVRSQWLHLEDGDYYLDSDGAATIGWADVDDARRYFDERGVLQTGWIDDGSGKTYWIKPEDGTLASHEWVEIDGVYQAFDDDGSWVTLGDVVPPGDADNLANMSERQRRVITACDETPWPGKALCAGWVSSVFVNAGEAAVGGDACDVARAWCTSDDLAELKPGMVIAVTTHPRTDNGRIWGHVCIYIGNGLIRDSGSYGVRKSSLGSWLAWFGASETPRWGWANGVNLEVG